MVFLTTIVHCTFYSAFSLGFLVNTIAHFSGPYVFLLVLCVVQVVIDVIIMKVPDYSSTSVLLANVGTLVLSLAVQSILTRLLCLWSNSMLPAIPQHPHHVVRVSEMVLHGLRLISAILGLSAIICLGIPPSAHHPSLAQTGIRLLIASLWLLALDTIILLGISLYLAFYTLPKAPEGMDIRRKRNQVIRLSILAILLSVFYVFAGIGLFVSSYVMFIGGCSLYLMMAVCLWPGALSNYDRLPGSQVVDIDPDGEVVIHRVDQEAMKNDEIRREEGEVEEKDQALIAM